MRLDQRQYQYLYSDGDSHTFMDTETFDQVTLGADILGEEQTAFLQENMIVTIEVV